MTLPIIQALWVGEKLSIMEELCVASFIQNGHSFHLYCYSDVENVPLGAKICDANEIISSEHVFKHKSNGSYAAFADWFRWELLWLRGGFWVDMDVACLKPFNFDMLPIFAWEGELVCPAVLGFEPRDPFCDFMRMSCRYPNTFLPYDTGKTKARKLWRRLTNNTRSNTKWGEAGGPVAVTKALAHFDMLHQAKPFTYFFPIHFSCWKNIFDSTLKNDMDLFSDSYAVHFWNEMTRKDPPLNKSSCDKNSLFMQLHQRFFPSIDSQQKEV